MLEKTPHLGRRIGESFFGGDGAAYLFIYLFFLCVSVYLFIFGAV